MPPKKQNQPFRGEIRYEIPRTLLDQHSQSPWQRALYCVGAGYYPRAAGHDRRRKDGANEQILILCTRGEGWYDVGGARGAVPAGNALLIPPGVPCAYGASAANPWGIHWTHFLGEEAASYQHLLADNNFTLPCAKKTQERMVLVFHEIHSVLDRGYAPASLNYLSHALRYLLGLLFFANPAYSPHDRERSRHDVDRWIDFMHDNLHNPLYLEELSEYAGLSVPHFSATFQSQTGLAPMEYLIQLRMQKACTLLDTTSLAVAEIGSAVSYDDPFYFSRIFRKVMGVSPRGYRNRQKH